MGAVSKKTVRDHLSARVVHPLYSIPLALPTISNSIGPNRSVPHRNGITDGMLSCPRLSWTLIWDVFVSYETTKRAYVPQSHV